MSEEWGQPVAGEEAGSGQYSVIAKLGQGGMAGVFLAVARGAVTDFHKLVVLKRLHDRLREDAGFVRMFVREAQIAARLNHPNVVHTYSVDLDEGQPVLVMEYLDGVPLSALRKALRGRPFEERWLLLAVIAQSLAGLHYVHDLADYDGTPMGLVHRDIKPANVFLTFDGQVKVLDFGIAKATAPGQDPTNSHVLKGTARYMAPEAVGGERTIDRRADVFSVGVMLWEAASGKRLWDGAEELQIIRRLMDNDVPSPDVVSPDVPTELAAICTKALQLDPNDRYATAAELREALVGFLRDRGWDDYEAPLRAFLEENFGERRTLRAAVIRERLAESKQVRGDGREDMRTLPSPGGSLSSGSAPASAPSVSELAPAPPAPRRVLPLVLAAGLSLVVGGLAVWLWPSKPAAPAPAAAPAAVSNGSPAAPEPAPKPEPKPAPEPEPEVPEPEAPEPEAPEPETPEPAAGDAAPEPVKRTKRRRRGTKAAASAEPPPEPAPEPEPARPLQPGDMPTKKDNKKSGLSIDKESPWGGQP